MKRYVCVLLFSISAFLFSKEFDVPMGMKGNQIIFTVQNHGSVPLKDVTVEIESAPSWFVLESGSTVAIDSLAPGMFQDAVFSFSVEKGEAGRAGTVSLLVKDQDGKSLGRRQYDLITALERQTLTLFPCYPNPANPSATIQFSLPESGRVRVEIYNVLGQRVRTLLDEEMRVGLYDVVWQGTDDRGQAVSTGNYLIRLMTEIKGKTERKTTKLLLKK